MLERRELSRFWQMLAAAGVAVGLMIGTTVADTRLDPRVAPTFQSIELSLDADVPDFSGSVSIHLDVKEAVSQFTLHSEGHEFQSLVLTGSAGVAESSHARSEDSLVTVTTASPLMPGTYTLDIAFTSTFNTKSVGLYRMEFEGQGYLFTQFEATDARKAFPCWDEPIFKIPYQMSLRVPERFTAVANTPLEGETTADGWRTMKFRKTPPMPSYLLALASGPLESVPIAGLSVPGRIYTARGQSHMAGLAAELTPPILAALEDFFARPYPYDKLDFIAVPEYWPGAMENPGAVTFKDSLLLLDPGRATLAQKRRLVEVTAHELAHMWFGDLVTMAWWDDLWLNESFASWMGSKIAQGLHPDHKGELTDRRSIQGLMSADARPSTRPIRRNVEKLSDIWEDFGLQYGKGQTVLGMVEQWVGPEIFRRGINDYINEHAWGNAHAADLWAALSKASGQDISGPLSGFLDQTGLPLVQASIEPGGVVKISQQRFLNHGVQAGQQNWTFPVRLKVAAGGKVETRTVIMDGAASTVEFNGEVDWLLPDAGAYGYYRWEVPQPLMARLAREAGENLSAAERIAFLGNAAALLDHGTMSGGDYLEILNAFADDPEPEVVSTMISGLGKVEGAFVSDDLKDEFAVYLRATLRPILDRFGFDRKPGEDEAISLFRPRLIGWLGFSARDPEVQARAAQLARTYMKKPESMDPSLAGTVLAVAARSGDQALYDAFRKKFETTTSPTDRGRYLGALGSFTDEKIRQQALAYSLDGPLRANEIFTIPGAISGESEADQDRILQWVMSHYKDLSGRIPAQFHPRLTSFAGGCSAARLESGRAFFMDPAQRVDGTENALKKVTERVHDCLSLRQREGAAVMAYLEAAPAAQAASRSGTAPH